MRAIITSSIFFYGDILTEADTCRKFILKKIYDAGWDDDQIQEQRTFTDGRIVVIGNKAQRRAKKRVDYLLRYTRDLPLAVIEAKSEHKNVGDGLQQAKDYAEILGLRFAYAANGKSIIEFDYTTGIEKEVPDFPSPIELWKRLQHAENLDDVAASKLLTPANHITGKIPRYYQEIAINRSVQAILTGRKRVLLTMATGTGKTVVAFQICWKLWNARWNRTGEHRRPKILFLADRNILVDDPKDKTFAAFGDARHKIGDGGADEPIKSREIYFSTYQRIAEDEARDGLYKQYSRDFFDLIIIDECHRGSSRDDSNWRDILEYFKPAYQLGMTATPLREDNRDTYSYFGAPVYTYSLRQGIDDGFLAPYRVHRVLTTWDAVGWRPSQGDLDRYGREIPDGEYGTKDFEKVVSLKARTQVLAKHITDFLKATGRYAKTIVFCVDQEHADEMRRALGNLNSDLVKNDPNYVCRVTANDGDIGKGFLSRFQELETTTPTILTTSQLLTTGVDCPTCKNIILTRVINSMTEFKQIIGRGTRVRDDYDKYYFNILDYVNATRLFADPDFDGEPVIDVEITVDDDGNEIDDPVIIDENPIDDDDNGGGTIISEPPDIWPPIDDPEPHEPRKFYFDGGQVEIAAHLVYELDPNGKQLNVVQYSDYTADSVRTLFKSSDALLESWIDPERRSEIISNLEERGIDFNYLAETTNQLDADPFDLLCHIAYNAPLRTRRERAERLRKNKMDFFDEYGPHARAVLEELLDKYAEHGTAQFAIPDILKVPPISDHGNVMEIVKQFGGPERLREAINKLQSLLYAA